ncbi:hypothetical protein HPY42_03535 [Coprothermobacteraceae bacterium]|nr:hypothetical protein [Coprothermobacteraceae bacterium]
MKEVLDVIGIVAGRQDLVLPMELLDKLRRDPYLVEQISLPSRLKDEITAKTAHQAMENLWHHFLAELDELLPLIFAQEQDGLRSFYSSRFKGTPLNLDVLRSMPYGDVLWKLIVAYREALAKGELAVEQDWRTQWLNFLEGEYYSGSFLAGVLRYLEMRYQTVSGLSYALLRSERA